MVIEFHGHNGLWPCGFMVMALCNILLCIYVTGKVHFVLEVCSLIHTSDVLIKGMQLLRTNKHFTSYMSLYGARES